jgi:hypothetical protein
MIAGVFIAVFAWTTDPAGPIAWSFRIGGPLLSVLSLAAILAMHFRADKAPDFLAKQVGRYFNRDGLGFAIVPSQIGDVAYLEAWFQNQYDRALHGQIAVRPSRGFFLTRAPIEAIVYDIQCPAGGFGVASIAIPIPAKLQGKKHQFEVGASVDYPDGKGHRLRFADGLQVRANSQFRNVVGTTLMIAGAATGQFVLVTPARTRIQLPEGVLAEFDKCPSAKVEIHWRLGDK